MATITTEYGKLSSNKTRTVYLRIRSGKTEKRINTQVKVAGAFGTAVVGLTCLQVGASFLQQAIFSLQSPTPQVRASRH